MVRGLGVLVCVEYVSVRGIYIWREEADIWDWSCKGGRG